MLILPKMVHQQPKHSKVSLRNTRVFEHNFSNLQIPEPPIDSVPDQGVKDVSDGEGQSF
jgi:hypothetical protein